MLFGKTKPHNDPYNFSLYEDGGYDPLRDSKRKQGVLDSFFSFSLETIRDHALLASPASLKELY